MSATHDHSDINVGVGFRIAERRKAVGMELSDLAKALGINDSMAKKYEDGTAQIPASVLYRVSELLQVPVGHFFGEENPESSSLRLAEFIRRYCQIKNPNKRDELADLCRQIALKAL
jgi:transcriptional regulator with XRE-family HTH domain